MCFNACFYEIIRKDARPIRNCRADYTKNFRHILPRQIEASRYSVPVCVFRNGPDGEKHIIFKNYRMKTYTSKSAKDNDDNGSVWESFIEYLNTVYYEGASESLDPELVQFEYSAFLSCYGN